MSQTKRTASITILAGLLGYGIAAAQFQALDPVRAAPHIFEIVLENDWVRVLKVTERNGETAPLHSHPESLIVHLSPCAWMEELEDGTRNMQSFRLGDAVWRDRITHGGDTSNVVQECSRLEIEMK
jgi:hypothetical protein